MFWLQGKKWTEIFPQDYCVIMPNPHFNDLQRPLVLPDEVFPYMQNMVINDLQIWNYHKNLNLNPWQMRENNRVLTEDIRILEMMQIMENDLERRRQKTAQMQNKEEYNL